MNEPLSKAYYLKEQLREIWVQVEKKDAEKVLVDWVEQAKSSKIPQLQKMAMTILAWYDYHISTGKVEGINNKINNTNINAFFWGLSGIWSDINMRSIPTLIQKHLKHRIYFRAYSLLKYQPRPQCFC